MTFKYRKKILMKKNSYKTSFSYFHHHIFLMSVFLSPKLTGGPSMEFQFLRIFGWAGERNWESF